MIKSRDQVLDIVKGIAIILVVIGHVIQQSMTAQGQDFYLNPVFKVIYTFHMPLFVFISGYLIASSLNKKVPIEVFKSRYQSLFIPGVFWGLLGCMTSYCLNKTLDPTIWFVWFLFALFVAACLLLFSVELEKKLGPFAFVAVYVCIMIIPYNNYCEFYYIQWFYLFYIVGYFMNEWDIKIINPWLQRIVLFVSLILFTLLVSCWTKNDYIYIHKMSFIPQQYWNEIPRMIYRYMTGFLGIYIIFSIGKYIAKIRLGEWLALIGVYSLDIYLIQRYLVEGLYSRVSSWVHLQFDLNSFFFLCIFVPSAAAFYVYVCIMVSKMIFRRSHLLNKFLLGDRS